MRRCGTVVLALLIVVVIAIIVIIAARQKLRITVLYVELLL